MSQKKNWTPSPGVVLGGRYEIEQELGKGGMAQAWRAQDRRNGERVAVKHIYFGGENYSRAPGKVERMVQNEIDVLRQIRDAGGHPNIIDLYDVISERGTQLAVVELVEGEELDDPSLSISESDARRITMDLADAMGFLHRNEIIYRDLAPENAMLEPDGSPKLIDFNTAKVVESDLQAKQTCPDCGHRVETNDYVCPSCGQQLSGGKDTVIGGHSTYKPPEATENRAHLRQGPWSDVYSLGKVFFMLIMGTDQHIPPVEGEGPQAFGTDCRDYNDEIIRRATKENYEERYRNARVLQKVLETKDPEPPTQATLTHRETGNEWTISPGDTIGRRGADGPAATITIDDPKGDYISAVQLQFDIDENDNWLLRDQSLNGTYVQAGRGWQRVLCENGRQRLQKKGHDPTDRHGNIPPEELQLPDGALIALVDPTYNVTFSFERTI